METTAVAQSSSSPLSNGRNRSHFGAQRSFTLPPRLASAAVESRQDKARDAATIEILFAHPAARIIAFSTVTQGLPSPNNGSAAEELCKASPRIPWRSQTERTIAAGALRVYRVPGSVAFLNSGNIVHPILAKSQCWCVDNETIFVLRVRSNSFFRIELPNVTAQDLKTADHLRETLKEISQFEKTTCPFLRDFEIDLPEAPDTIKKPWRPKGPLHLPSESHQARSRTVTMPASTSAAVSVTNSVSSDQHTDERPSQVETASMQPADPFISAASDGSGPWRPMEISVQAVKADSRVIPRLAARLDSSPLSTPRSAPPSTSSHDLGASRQHDLPSRQTDQADDLSNLEATRPSDMVNGNAEDGLIWIDEFPAQIAHDESTDGSVPPESTRTPSPRRSIPSIDAIRWLEDEDVATPRQTSKARAIPTDELDAVSLSSSLDSFHSFHDPVFPLLETPTLALSKPRNPSSANEHEYPDEPRLSRSVDHLDENYAAMSLTPEEQRPETANPSLGRDSSDFDFHQDILNPDPARSRSERHRSISPAPPLSNIYYPPRSPSQYLTSDLFRRTYSLLLGPPIQLVVLMLDLASRIANGSSRDSRSSLRRNGSSAIYTRESGKDPVDPLDDWEVDYGISFGGVPASGPRWRKGHLRND